MDKVKIDSKRNENGSFLEREMELSTESRMWLESDIPVCSGGDINIFLIFFCSAGKPRCRMLNQGCRVGCCSIGTVGG